MRGDERRGEERIGGEVRFSLLLHKQATYTQIPRGTEMRWEGGGHMKCGAGWSESRAEMRELYFSNVLLHVLYGTTAGADVGKNTNLSDITLSSGLE